MKKQEHLSELVQPAFLSGVSISTLSSSQSYSTSICTKRPNSHIKNVQASISSNEQDTPPPPPSSSSPSTLNNVAKASAIAAAASLLAFSTPSFDQYLSNPSNSPIHVSSAYATGRGGGASFTSASGYVNKDPESLLRWSLPIDNKPIRSVQQELETAMNELKGLKWNNVDSHVKKATMILNKQTDKIVQAVPEEYKQDSINMLSNISETISTNLGNAVVQKNADKVVALSKNILRDVGKIEQFMVTKFPYEVPSEYNNIPQLKGRATVEMVVQKQADDQFDINGTFYKQGKLTLILDGYSAPVSAGNFIDLVNKTFYNGIDVLRSDGFIVQSGKPSKGDGFVDKSTGELRTIPLELFVKGDKMPTYGITLEEDGRGASSTVLPFTSYGTLAVARNEFEANSASSQFFWFLFEPDLTPAGRNLMDGNWSVMGYTVGGEEYLRQLQKGDVIVSAKVTQGLENLVNAS